VAYLRYTEALFGKRNSGLVITMSQFVTGIQSTDHLADHDGELVSKWFTDSSRYHSIDVTSREKGD
jgi:hypothetical protein